jgi:hypothetical protein
MLYPVVSWQKQHLGLVMMAEGNHAYPSRTRPLSLPAPMVLGPQGPGRVGRCQADTRTPQIFDDLRRSFFISKITFRTQPLHPPPTLRTPKQTLCTANLHFMAEDSSDFASCAAKMHHMGPKMADHGPESANVMHIRSTMPGTTQCNVVTFYM